MKNHKFIIDLAKRLKEENSDFLIVFVGDGELRAEIEYKVKESFLEKNIVFLGIRNDIPILMRVFDVLIMPSLFEGLGGVVIEAQAAGTPCIVSDTLPPEVDLGIGLVDYTSLSQSKDIWAKKIYEKKNKDRIAYQDIDVYFKNRGYTLESSEKYFRQMYSIGEYK